MTINTLAHLSDGDVIAAVARLARCEREATVQLVAHLSELDARRLYLAAGFSSLFAYCCEVLRLSEHETYHRIEAARAARRFPVILEVLSKGAINLTTVRLLSTHLTDSNHRELLAEASHRSKREVEELVARHFPRPDVVSTVRKLPATRPTSDAAAVAAPALPAPRATLPAPAPPSRPAVIAPLAPSRYEIRFTASAGTREKLRQAQDLLRHAIPSGDPGEIMDRALTLLLEDLARKKPALVKEPRPKQQPAASGSRHIPARVRREVWLRDGGRCAFASPGSGRRCAARGFLEFHHVRPYGAGGEATVQNIQLRCRAHNGYEADLFYGARCQLGPDRVDNVPLKAASPHGRNRDSDGGKHSSPASVPRRAARAAPPRC
jgi:hypothetical protein